MRRPLDEGGDDSRKAVLSKAVLSKAVLSKAVLSRRGGAVRAAVVLVAVVLVAMVAWGAALLLLSGGPTAQSEVASPSGTQVETAGDAAGAAADQVPQAEASERDVAGSPGFGQEAIDSTDSVQLPDGTAGGPTEADVGETGSAEPDIEDPATAESGTDSAAPVGADDRAGTEPYVAPGVVETVQPSAAETDAESGTGDSAPLGNGDRVVGERPDSAPLGNGDRVVGERPDSEPLGNGDRVVGERPDSEPVAGDDAGGDVALAVRVLYAVPSDRETRTDHSEGIARAATEIQSWFGEQLGGLTFALHGDLPQHCKMSEPAAFYGRHSWQKIIDSVQHCAPVKEGDTTFVWAVYADVLHECGPKEEGYNELGGLSRGLTILGRWDLDGLVGEDGDVGNPCWLEDSPNQPIGRFMGGLAHELGHAFGLPHPPGCDEGLPTCDTWALMFAGYAIFPDADLRADDKERLIRSRFINLTPGSGPRAASPGSSRVRGSVSGPGGAPIEGVWVSLAGEDFWAWAATGADGAFEIAVPDGAAGTASVSVHAGETASCRWLGYLDASGGLTASSQQAQSLDIGAADISGADIALSASPAELCRNAR